MLSWRCVSSTALDTLVDLPSYSGSTLQDPILLLDNSEYLSSSRVAFSVVLMLDYQVSNVMLAGNDDWVLSIKADGCSV